MAENSKLYDALQWLFAELEHIRRIHFISIVLSSVIIITTLIGHSTLTSDLYKEVERFRNFAKQLSSEEIDSYNLFSKHIENYQPEGIPEGYGFFLSGIPKNQMIKLIPTKIAPLKINDLDHKILHVIRNRIEQIGTEATLVHKINIDKKTLEEYDGFKNRAIKDNLGPGNFGATIKEWPSEGKPGKIEYFMEVGKIKTEFPRRLGEVLPPEWPHSVWPLRTYRASATFLTKKEFWQIDANWFKENFPNLVNDWHKYENETLGNLFIKIRRNLTQNLRDIDLPLGLTVPAQYVVPFLPILMVLTFLVLLVEVSHLSDFARFCKQEWNHSPFLISPWIGGRNKWYRQPLLVITLIILPILSTIYLTHSFPIFGYYKSLLFGIVLAFIYIVLGCVVIKRGKDISLISFQTKDKAN